MRHRPQPHYRVINTWIGDEFDVIELGLRPALQFVAEASWRDKFSALLDWGAPGEYALYGG